MGNRTVQSLASALCSVTMFIAISTDALAQKPNVVSAMAQFDRALIPALFVTEDSEPNDSRARTVAKVVGAWAVLKRTLETQAETSLKKGTGEVDDRIGRLREFQSTTSGSLEAHALLLQVRDALRTIRSNVGLRYFPDLVVEFQDQLVEIELPLKDGNFEAVRDGMTELASTWSEIAQFRIDKIAYGLDYYRMGEFGAYRETATASLETLRGAIDAKDAILVSTELKTIQINMMALYKLFGNFEE